MSLKTVPMHRYCELSGEKENAVLRRCQRGIWIEGKHWHKIKGVKERWIDLEAVEKWARNGGLSRVA